MSWKENRRRKRVWYQHYSSIAKDIMAIASRGGCSGEELLMLFFNLYESRRLHGKRRIANSAYDSIMLAVKDTGLSELRLVVAPAAPPAGDGTYPITFTAANLVNQAVYPKDDYKEVPF